LLSDFAPKRLYELLRQQHNEVPVPDLAIDFVRQGAPDALADGRTHPRLVGI
jgi:hypothetical protein